MMFQDVGVRAAGVSLASCVQYFVTKLQSVTLFKWEGVPLVVKQICTLHTKYNTGWAHYEAKQG